MRKRSTDDFASVGLPEEARVLARSEVKGVDRPGPAKVGHSRISGSTGPAHQASEVVVSGFNGMLHRAGWPLGENLIGSMWQVDGSNGENGSVHESRATSVQEGIEQRSYF
jgi:hypothetical protein